MYFSPEDMNALKSMTGADEEDDGHVYGSAMGQVTPGTVMGKDGKKEIAAPNSKIEVKVNNRAIGGGATEESIK